MMRQQSLQERGGGVENGSMTTTTSSSSGSSTTSTMAVMTLGFFLGIATSTLTAMGTYLWYYRHERGNHKTPSSSTSSSSKWFSPSTATTSRNATTDVVNDETWSVSFLSDIVQALWNQINAVAITKIQSTCQPILDQLSASSYLLRNLRLTHVSLGHVPIRFEHVIVSDTYRINPITKQKYIQIKCDMIWDGECDIQLQCAMGPFGIRAVKFRGTLLIDCQPLVDTTSMISAIQYAFVQTPELYISDFTGIAQIADVQSIKRMIQTSILQSITDMMVLPIRTVMRMSSSVPVSFLDIYQPPLGLTRITLLQGYGFDSNQQKSSLLPVVNAEPSTTTTTTGITGIDSTTTATTSNISECVSNWFRDVPDIYCTIQIGCSSNSSTGISSLWTSSIIRNTTNPIWTVEDPSTTSTESLVYDCDQIVTITCYDNNMETEDDVFGLQSDTVLGIAKITLSELLFHKVHAIPLQQYLSDAHSVVGTITAFTGSYIQVQCDLYPFVPDVSYLKQPSLSRSYTPTAMLDDKAVWNPPDESDAVCGLLTVLIGQAYDLPIAEQTSFVGATSYVMVTFGTTLAEPFIAIATTKGANPLYDREFHVPITYQMMYDVQYNVQLLPSIILSVMDGEPPIDLNTLTDPNIISNQRYGSIEISIATIVQSPDCIISGKQVLIGGSHAHNAKLEYLCSLHGVAKPSHDDTSPPDMITGVALPSSFIKVTVAKGWGFQVEKRTLKLDDIPDIYCTIQLGSNPTIWTTSTIKNSTTPTWNESHSFFVAKDMAISSIILQVNVYDSDTGKFDTDDEIGTIRIPITKILRSPNQTHDCALLQNGKPTNSFITIQCEKVVSK